jgi:hypothetical protein
MDSILQKQVQLAAPGSVTEDVLWYSPLKTSVHQVEVNHLVGRTQISGNSTNLGGTAEHVVGSSEICGYFVLTVQLTVPANAPNVVASNGWLYLAIKQLQWLFGAQSGVQPAIDGLGIADYNHVCSFQKVRDSHMWVGGQPINGPGVYSASILIPAPQSNMLAGKHKALPIDTQGLSSSLIVRITYGPATSFLTGADAALITNWSYATLNVETFELARRNESPYQLLRLNPGVSLSYPFSYLQTMSQITAGNVLANQPFVATLNGFLAADPLVIFFTVTPVPYYQQVPTNNSPLCYRSARCKYFELRLNGQIYAKLENGSGAITEQLEAGSGYDRKIYIPTPAPDGNFYYPTTFASRRCPVYVWQASITRAPAFDGIMMNTRRTPSTLLTLTFTVDDDEPVNMPYNIHWVFAYSALMGFQAGATTVIY